MLQAGSNSAPLPPHSGEGIRVVLAVVFPRQLAALQVSFYQKG